MSKKVHAHLCGGPLLLWPEARVPLEVNSEYAFHTSAALLARSHERPCGIHNHCPLCRFHQYFCSGHHFSWLLSSFFKWPGFFLGSFPLGAVKFPWLVTNWILMSCQPQRKFPQYEKKREIWVTQSYDFCLISGFTFCCAIQEKKCMWVLCSSQIRRNLHLTLSWGCLCFMVH